MIRSKYSPNGKIMTANELAKYLVWDKGEAAHYWSESSDDIYDNCTEKERAAIDEAIFKHIKRVRRFLNMETAIEKYFSN